MSSDLLNQKILDRFRIGYKSLILIFKLKSRICDLFVSIAISQNLATERVLKETQALRDFIDRFYSDKSALSDVQRSVISQLSKSSYEEVLSTLSISRCTYYVILSELRSLYGVINILRSLMRVPI